MLYQFNWETFLWQLLFYLIFLIVMAIFLNIALRMVKSENTNFGRVFLTAFLITIVVALVGFIFGLFLSGIWLNIIVIVVGLIFSLLVISGMHKTGFWRALLVAIIAFVLYILVYLLIAFILSLFGIYI